MLDISKSNYKNWPNSYTMSNDKIELVALSDVGPRIIRYGFIGEPNQFVEFPEQSGLTGGNEWRIYGGHRLWHSPEDLVRTYYPDNQPVHISIAENRLVLVQPEENLTKLQKKIEISMNASTGDATIIHTISNNNLWDIRLAAWAISAMAPGGLSILKQRSGSSKSICIPNLTVNIWPHSSINDSRVVWGKDYVLLKQDSHSDGCFKTGLYCNTGWVAYANDNVLFVKYFEFDSHAEYPDSGSSVELYTCSKFSEIETLSPYVSLAPGSSITHKEVWKLIRIGYRIEKMLSETFLDSEIVPLVSQLNPFS